MHPRRADIPIYLAAIGPKNVELTAEIADGWLPIFFSPTRFRETYGAAIDAGFAKAGGGKSLADFDVAPTATVIVGDDLDLLRGFVKPMAALYIGGMGARGKNFYNDLACRYGFEDAAKKIQDLYLDGNKKRRDRGGARRAGRRDRADRAEGAHRGPARGVEGERHHHADRRRAAARGARR